MSHVTFPRVVRVSAPPVRVTRVSAEARDLRSRDAAIEMYLRRANRLAVDAEEARRSERDEIAVELFDACRTLRAAARVEYENPKPDGLS